MSRFINHLRKAALTLSLGAAALLATPAAEAATMSKNSATAKSTATRIAPQTNLRRPSLASAKLAHKTTPSLNMVKIPAASAGQLTSTRTASSPALDKVAGGGVPGKSLERLAGSRGVLGPTDFSRFDKLQKIPDLGAALRAMHGIPSETSKAPITFHGPGEGPSLVDLINQSQGSTRHGLSDKEWVPAGSTKPTLPFQDQMNQARKMSEQLATEVGAALGQYGLRDSRFETGKTTSPQTPLPSSQLGWNETDSLAEASFNFPGLTHGADLMSQGRGIDPRTAADVTGEYYNKDGVRVVKLDNGYRRVDVSDGATKDGKSTMRYDGNKIGTIVHATDKNGNVVHVFIAKDKDVHPTVLGHDGEILGGGKKPKPATSNPNPYADDLHGDIDAEWVRRFKAKLTGAVDPADEFGQPSVDVDKLISRTIAAAMSKVNPNPDAPAIEPAGGGTLPGEKLIIPEFKVSLPKSGKGPKPQVGPGGPVPRGFGGGSPLTAEMARSASSAGVSSQGSLFDSQDDETTGGSTISGNRGTSSR